MMPRDKKPPVVGCWTGVKGRAAARRRGICQAERGTVAGVLLSDGFLLFWLVIGWVDPRADRQLGRGGWPADEALGVRAVGVSQYQCPAGPHGRGSAVVNVGGGVQAEAAVAVLVVVPGEEVLAVRSCCLDRVEAAGEVRPVLEGLELAFRERVVVADVRAAVGLGDSEVGQQQRDRLGGHR